MVQKIRLPYKSWNALLIVVALSGGLTGPARGVTPAEADLAFNALNKVYWNPANKYFFKEDTRKQKADFWFEAQLWDTVMDQYDRTHSTAVKAQVNDVYDGFVKAYPDWTKNEFNDDIMWWAVACTRAYVITGNERYLKKARASFDFVYDHFTDDTYGGGIYWINKRTCKTAALIARRSSPRLGCHCF